MDSAEVTRISKIVDSLATINLPPVAGKRANWTVKATEVMMKVVRELDGGKFSNLLLQGHHMKATNWKLLNLYWIWAHNIFTSEFSGDGFIVTLSQLNAKWTRYVDILFSSPYSHSRF